MQGGAADLGVVPFENSTHGVVTFTLDGLADRAGRLADLAVCGEVYLDVHHFLLGYRAERTTVAGGSGGGGGDDSDGRSSSSNKGPVPHLASAGTFGQQQQQQQQDPSLSHIRRVQSHPQALGQCDAFLSSRLAGVERVDVSSTSRAAELAAADRTGATAAVAGEMAAGAFGLDVLARCIEDRDDNTTRFFVLRRRRRNGETEEGEEEEKKSKEGGESGGGGGGKGYKSLVSFTVPHRSPGALAGVLDAFRKYGLNLTSINSLPSLIQPFQYLFFVEFEGSRHRDPDGRVAGALGEIDRVAEGWRWLGSWERRR